MVLFRLNISEILRLSDVLRGKRIELESEFEDCVKLNELNDCVKLSVRDPTIVYYSV